MSFFGQVGAAGHIGGRGTWIASSSARSHDQKPQMFATSSRVSLSFTDSVSDTASGDSMQIRMATHQQQGQGSFAFGGSLTLASSTSKPQSSKSGRKFEPHSPSSSPPQVPLPVDDWDETDKTMDSSPHQSPDGCICNRRYTEINCVSCGMLFEGRVRIPCPNHPNTIHLMDMERCPVCRGANLTETPPKMSKSGGRMGMHSRPH